MNRRSCDHPPSPIHLHSQVHTQTHTINKGETTNTWHALDVLQMSRMCDGKERLVPQTFSRTSGPDVSAARRHTRTATRACSGVVRHAGGVVLWLCNMSLAHNEKRTRKSMETRKEHTRENCVRLNRITIQDRDCQRGGVRVLVMSTPCNQRLPLGFEMYDNGNDSISNVFLCYFD